ANQISSFVLLWTSHCRPEFLGPVKLWWLLPPTKSLPGNGRQLRYVRIMSACANEPQKVFACNACRGRIFQRMTVDRVELQQRLIDDDADTLLAIIDKCKGCYRTGRHAQNLHHQIGIAEAQSCRTDAFGQALEVDLRLGVRDDEV